MNKKIVLALAIIAQVSGSICSSTASEQKYYTGYKPKNTKQQQQNQQQEYYTGYIPKSAQ